MKQVERILQATEHRDPVAAEELLPLAHQAVLPHKTPNQTGASGSSLPLFPRLNTRLVTAPTRRWLRLSNNVPREQIPVWTNKKRSILEITKTQFLKLVRFLSILYLAVWAAAPRASAQTPLGLRIQINAGHAQLTVTGALGTVCQIQWADNLSSTDRWFHLNHCVLSNSPTFLTDSNVASAAARYYRAVWTPSTNLVWIPPGTFTMGSPANEVDRDPDEGPQTMVTISRGFWMGKYLVTQGNYLSVVGSNPSFFQGDDATRPVEQVSWNDATNYCALATAQELAVGRIPTNCVYRLPTEAEWEHACRAGTTTRFYYGDDLGYTNLVNYAWYLENNDNTTRSVGQKLPNAFGLYDMAGNVFEWCQDWYGQYAGGSVTDPQGPGLGSFRVIRGGCWFADAKDCRSALRGNAFPTDSNLIQGFRVLLAPGQP